MLLKNACVIKKISIHDVDSVKNDPDIIMFLEAAPDRLGKNGRFMIRLSGIPQENSVLAEGKSKRRCSRCVEEFEKLLIKKGYMDH